MTNAAKFLTAALAAGAVSAAAPLSESTSGMPVRFAHIDLDTGVRLRYAEAGDPAGEPIIMLHGYSDSWYSFSPIIPLLGSRYRLLALDQRGHGASGQPASGYAMSGLARDVLAFMDELDIRRATIVGHSMGSFVAQQAGLAAPERVIRLVLIGSGTDLRSMNDRDAFEGAVQSLEDPVPLEFIRGFQASTIHHPVPPGFLDSVVVESTRLTARVWKALLEGMFATARAEELASAGIPTLLVWGEEDSVFPKSNRDALAGMLPHAERLDYEDTGHATHWERPVQFVEDLEDFIRRTPAKGDAR
jgi:pimeloyl-ACP methyl ester carboxylesterase